MDTYYIQLFPKTQEVPFLRLFSPNKTLIEERPIDSTAVDHFTTQVEEECVKITPNLATLGQLLYAWMNGPTQRWLESLCHHRPGLALHIDVDERLRHLPWELMAPAPQQFLCGDALQPFTPVRTVTDQLLATKTANRPLRVLFMATSPADVKPLLNFEDEEGKILDATRNLPLELIVEESGSLEGLQYLIESFGPGYFDVFHLSGHADVIGGVPHFIMENDVGLRQDATAEEIAQVFAALWPRLVFLSGCRTSQAPHQSGLPSLSEALVKAGAPAVLGWALPVGDTAASMLAAHLYASLAKGSRIDEAVARARQHLFKQNIPNWHLLRLYANATPLDEVVTRLNTPGRQRSHYWSASQDFLDALGRSRVASRECFVGRRLQIQRCLKALRLSPSTDEVYQGLLLHGMGGSGKSTLAARLCERMSQTHQRAVWFGKLDETEILKLTSKVRFPEIELLKEANDILNQPDTGLQTRLECVFRGPMATTSCLFVFDSFEDGNLDESARGSYVATPEALRILAAFLGAIYTTNADSRLIITSRYQFPIPSDGQVYAEGMESMRGAELEKKLQLLSSLRNDANTSKALRERAIAIAAGNPRLLECLDRILADPETEPEAIFLAMEEKTAEFREDVLAETLLDRQQKALRQMLALVQIFDIPVPQEAIQAVAGQDRVTTYLERAMALSLIESGIDPATKQTCYLVSKILAPLLANDISNDERKAAYARGATVLHRLWVLGDHDAK